MKELQQIARKHGVYLLGGTYYNDKKRCCAPLIDAAGCVAGQYEKRTLTKHLGTEPGIFYTGLGRVSVLICRDVETAAYVEEARDAGAWLVINPCFVSGQVIMSAHARLG